MKGKCSKVKSYKETLDQFPRLSLRYHKKSLTLWPCDTVDNKHMTKVFCLS